MSETQAPFWLVWNPEGRNPMRMHDSIESAKKEAERLAVENRGRIFIVMESVEAVTFDAIRRVNMRPDRDCPL